MKLLALGAFLIGGYAQQLVSQHDASGDADPTGVLIGFVVVAVAAAFVLAFTIVRFEAERKRRAA